MRKMFRRCNDSHFGLLLQFGRPPCPHSLSHNSCPVVRTRFQAPSLKLSAWRLLFEHPKPKRQSFLSQTCSDFPVSISNHSFAYLRHPHTHASPDVWDSKSQILTKKTIMPPVPAPNALAICCAQDSKTRCSSLPEKRGKSRFGK